MLLWQRRCTSARFADEIKPARLAKISSRRFANLAVGFQQNRDAIFAAGAMSLLIALLTSDQLAVQVAASDALHYLSFGFQHDRDAMTAAGAVPLFVALLRSDQPTPHKRQHSLCRPLQTASSTIRMPSLQQAMYLC